MAKETIVVLRSDVSGEVIPEGEGETIAFSVGKNSYTIDLTSAEAAEFKKTLGKYTSVATQEVSRLPRSAGSSAPKSNKEELSKIRAWAQEQGLNVAPRGRISQDIQDKYRAAN
ncbi:Lsr2 family protein [Pseudarthrobacter sp902506025]|uniref:histone-like nucleoid-structuring protein Lsr2 n=1 Tax=Pseudarthrobacter sp. 902506025 TaxID=3155291 RepID=UPI00344D40C2